MCVSSSLWPCQAALGQVQDQQPGLALLRVLCVPPGAGFEVIDTEGLSTAQHVTELPLLPGEPCVGILVGEAPVRGS